MLGVRRYKDIQIDLNICDITTFVCDVMVNAANAELSGGGGVDGAIHAAGGPDIMAELSRLYSGCPAGDAVITGAGNLPAKKVIHAVGPIYVAGDKNQAGLLASCYKKSLALASEYQLKHVAFSALSCGVYGYPIDEASQVAMTAVKEFIDQNDPAIRRITFVLFNADVHQHFQTALFAAFSQ